MRSTISKSTVGIDHNQSLSKTASIAPTSLNKIRCINKIIARGVAGSSSLLLKSSSSSSSTSSISNKCRFSIGGRRLFLIRPLSSCVYEVGHQNTESKSVSRYALKCIPLQCPNEDSFEIERRARLEISALRQVSHENVITLLEEECGEVDVSSFFPNQHKKKKNKNSDHKNSSSTTCTSSTSSNCFIPDITSTQTGTTESSLRPDRFTYLLSPLYDTNLETYIERHGSIRNETVLSRLFGGICSGVEAIHARGMRHNDINPRNILLRFSEEDSKHLKTHPESSDHITPWPVICDFESVSPVTVEISSRWQAAEVAEFHLKHSAPAYRAPEIWKIAKSKNKNGAAPVDPASESVDDSPSTSTTMTTTTSTNSTSTTTAGSIGANGLNDSKRRKSKINTTTINSHADAFSIGCTLYFMMFRRHAFKKITSIPGKQPSRWIAFIPPKAYEKTPKFLFYTCLAMMIENPSWRLDVTQVLTSILPKGTLPELVTRGIWADYQGAPGLMNYNSLTECKGTPLILTIPQSPDKERGLNKRAVRMLGKGGTSVVKSLPMVEEVPIVTSPTQSLSKCNSLSDDDALMCPYDFSELHGTSPINAGGTIEGLLTRNDINRSDCLSQYSESESESNSFISWSEFRETAITVNDEFGFPVSPKTNIEDENENENEPTLTDDTITSSPSSVSARKLSSYSPFFSLPWPRRKGNSNSKAKEVPSENFEPKTYVCIDSTGNKGSKNLTLVNLVAIPNLDGEDEKKLNPIQLFPTLPASEVLSKTVPPETHVCNDNTVTKDNENLTIDNLAAIRKSPSDSNATEPSETVPPETNVCNDNIVNKDNENLTIDNLAAIPNLDKEDEKKLDPTTPIRFTPRRDITIASSQESPSRSSPFKTTPLRRKKKSNNNKKKKEVLHPPRSITAQSASPAYSLIKRCQNLMSSPMKKISNIRGEMSSGHNDTSNSSSTRNNDQKHRKAIHNDDDECTDEPSTSTTNNQESENDTMDSTMDTKSNTETKQCNTTTSDNDDADERVTIVKKGPLRQKRHQGFHKQVILKTVYLFITSEAKLICRNGHGNSSKVLCQVSLGDSEFVDVSLIGEAYEGNGYEFAISFSNSKKPSELGGLRLLAANESDARNWATCIGQTWKTVRCPAPVSEDLQVLSICSSESLLSHFKEEYSIC